jgi:HPt (histidine-containing phosphotransfer) domain-containing protein
MDIQMPELGGVEATAQIRTLSPPSCDVYIIAMTADAMRGAKEEYIAAGMNDYISKPVDANLLLSMLARLVPKKKNRVAEVQLAISSANSFEVTAPNPVLASSPALDHAKLAILESVLPFSNIDGLLTLFMTEVEHHLTRIRTSQAAADFDALAREAHSMVSSAGNVGAMEVSELARTLERACKEGRTPSIERLIGQLVEGCAAVTIALNEWLDERRSGGAQAPVALSTGNARLR